MPEDISLNSDEELVEKETSEPCGPPEPVKKSNGCAGKAITTTAVVVIGGAAFMILGVASTPCMGATRSARIQWQERDAEIEQAWRQLQNDTAKADQQPESKKPND